MGKRVDPLEAPAQALEDINSRAIREGTKGKAPTPESLRRGKKEAKTIKEKWDAYRGRQREAI